MDLPELSEIDVVRRRCDELGVSFAVSDHYASGGKGAEELARVVMKQAEVQSEPFTPLYELQDTVKDKILAVTKKMYGAKDVVFTKDAMRDPVHGRTVLGKQTSPIAHVSRHRLRFLCLHLGRVRREES